jgi:hypothetical protein
MNAWGRKAFDFISISLDDLLDEGKKEASRRFDLRLASS